MGVGAPEGLYPAVQVVPHGPLLAGGLGVEVHQHDVGPLHPLQNPVGGGEGVFKVAVHFAPADEVDHPDAQALRALIYPPAPAGHPVGVVGRAEGVAVVLQEIGDLDAVPGVVAQGDHVGPGVKNGPGLPGQDAHPGGVLPVDHGEVDVFQLFQLPQVAVQALQAAVPHHVAYRQDIQDHSLPPFLNEVYYM